MATDLEGVSSSLLSIFELEAALWKKPEYNFFSATQYYSVTAEVTGRVGFF